MKHKRKRKKRTINDDIASAIRRGSREAEIEMYGHSLSFLRVYKNKKKYNRQTAKNNDRREIERLD